MSIDTEIVGDPAACRRAAQELAEGAPATGRTSTSLARAMDQLTHDLDRATALLVQARDTARARRLVVEGTTILVPDAHADPDQHRAWRELRAVVAGIRELEARAHRDWEAALARDAGTSPLVHPSRAAGAVTTPAYDEALDEPA